VTNPSEPPMRDTTDSAISGIATSTRAPRITPFRLYTPVTTAPASSKKERLSGNALGDTPLISITSKPPASPAIPALNEKATAFFRPIFIPESWAAIGLSLNARNSRPYRVLIKFTSNQIMINAVNELIQKNHWYKEKSSPNLAGGTPISNINPCSPPKIGNWFAIVGSETAKARVVPARYGPLKRAAA